MERIKKNFLKINGCYYIFIALVMLTISTGISAFLLIKSHPQYDLFSLWMSDLAVSQTGILFNISIVISSFLILFFMGYYAFFLRLNNKSHTYTNLAMVFGIFSCVGLFLIGLFPVKYIGKASLIHSIGAFFYWSNSALFWTFLGFSEYYNPRIPKRIYIISFITAAFWIAFLLYLVWSIAFSIQISIFNKFPQWLAHFILIISYLEHGIYISKEHDSIKEPFIS